MAEHRAAGRRRRGGGKRRGVTLKRRHQASEPVELLLAKAGAHAPGVAQHAAFVDAEEQGPDALCAAPLPRRPAADHELLAAHPRAGKPAGLVATVQALGDDPLQALRGLPCRVRGLLKDALALRNAKGTGAVTPDEYLAVLQTLAAQRDDLLALEPTDPAEGRLL